MLQLNNGLVLEFKIIFHKLVPKCPDKDTSALVQKCPGSEVSWVRSVLGPKCLLRMYVLGLKITIIKTQMYQLMLVLFGRPTYLRLQELKCNSCNK